MKLVFVAVLTAFYFSAIAQKPAEVTTNCGPITIIGAVGYFDHLAVDMGTVPRCYHVKETGLSSKRDVLMTDTLNVFVQQVPADYVGEGMVAVLIDTQKIPYKYYAWDNYSMDTDPERMGTFEFVVPDRKDSLVAYKVNVSYHLNLITIENEVARLKIFFKRLSFL